MPFVLILVGLLLVVSAIRGTHGTLWNLFYSDLIGSGGSSGFVVWLVAILAIGFMGYYKPLEMPAKMLLGLVVLGIMLSNRGFFAKLSETFTQPLPEAVAPAATEPLPGRFPVEVTQQGGKSGSGAAGVVGQVAGAVVGAAL